MSTMFDRFAEMAKEEFGYTIRKSEKNNNSNFESLFGTSVENISEYELPYNINASHFMYCDDPVVMGRRELKFIENSFNVEKNFNFAA